VNNEIAGTGLGLQIMLTIVDRQAGDVVIDSREGEGTTVTVQLPRHVPGMPPVTTTLAPVTQSRAGSGSRQLVGSGDPAAEERTP
jgi:Histidine kinase-, DNA gyrase B-, and HSP90-like ATPase